MCERVGKTAAASLSRPHTMALCVRVVVVAVVVPAAMSCSFRLCYLAEPSAPDDDEDDDGGKSGARRRAPTVSRLVCWRPRIQSELKRGLAGQPAARRRDKVSRSARARALGHGFGGFRAGRAAETSGNLIVVVVVVGVVSSVGFKCASAARHTSLRSTLPLRLFNSLPTSLAQRWKLNKDPSSTLFIADRPLVCVPKVFRQGDDAINWYALLEGSVDVRVAQTGPGASQKVSFVLPTQSLLCSVFVSAKYCSRRFCAG